MERPLVQTEVLLDRAVSHLGEEAVRLGADPDAVDGQRPRVVVEPTTADRLAATLAWAAAEELTVLVRGGGTKLEWGGVAGPIDVLLSTAGLDAPLEHRHGDLTATIEAGTTLANVNATLAAHGQWLPLDPLWPERATVGGIVATNDSGPGRHRHGAPRDLIIGVTMALSDGQLAKAGGIVVKNVAGYDLSRLLTGSFGCLAVVTSATFKLAPIPASSRTVSIELGSIEEMDPVIARLVGSPLTPSALELEWPPARLTVRFESVETAVEQQALEVTRLVDGLGSVTVAGGHDESRLWTRYAQRWDEPGTVLKVSTLPTALGTTLGWLQSACAQHEMEMSAAGRAGLGVVEVRLRGPVAAQARVITQLRERLDPGSGSVVVRRGDRSLRQQVDPWGPIGDAFPLMHRVKDQFDPGGRLNPGRGPGGL